MNMRIDTDFPGGNLLVKEIRAGEAVVAVDQRDTPSPWFYWCFRAAFQEKGEYRFRFDQPNKIGTRGPAVSYDNGITWEWLGRACVDDSGCSFVYSHDGKGGPVIFCMGMQYQPVHLDRFLEAHADSPFLRKEILCRTRKGREVELLTIREPGVKSPHKLLLTSRHHCCEMMATYVLEGILLEALENAEVRRTFEVFAVPFADKDGVVDGDQGKGRAPHDHARDYGESPIYPETASIMKLMKEESIDFCLDLHCPWIHGKDNEAIYFVGPPLRSMEEKTKVFAEFLRKEAEGIVPYDGEILLYGTSWNTGANYIQGSPMRDWAIRQPFNRFGASMEIPYANAGETTFEPRMMRNFGRCIARAMIRFSQEIKK
ncbi:MAG: Zinc carboxypeptidase [Lentisphaerae bacterium ADurb.Bin242]|nr:MAG: Zinc carboxypeptidase [Lentisphaerae bacterium ADurb.Bin242]